MSEHEKATTFNLLQLMQWLLPLLPPGALFLERNKHHENDITHVSSAQVLRVSEAQHWMVGLSLEYAVAGRENLVYLEG